MLELRITTIWSRSFFEFQLLFLFPGVTGLIALILWFWFNFVRRYISWTFSIYFRFYSLVEYRFLKYVCMILWLSSAAMSSFLSLILLIWIFFFYFLVNVAKDLPVLLIFSEKQLFAPLILSNILFACLFLFCKF